MTEYNSKAINFDKYRWPYCSEAINHIISLASLDEKSVVADIGAGTGKLTLDFVHIVNKIYAVEPDENMLNILRSKTGQFSSVVPLKRFSHFMPEIKDNSIELIMAAHAVHWFDFDKTIFEFRRIAKNDCKLVFISNKNISEGSFALETGRLKDKYQDDNILDKQDFQNINNYFDQNSLNEEVFEFDYFTDFENYLGSLSSISYMPSENDEAYGQLKKDAFRIFSKYAKKGKILRKGQTQVLSGTISLI